MFMIKDRGAPTWVTVNTGHKVIPLFQTRDACEGYCKAWNLKDVEIVEVEVHGTETDLSCPYRAEVQR